MRTNGFVIAFAAAMALAVGCADSVEEVDIYATNFEPGVEMRDGVRILRLKGTPYEMGKQHATFLHDELVKGVEFLETTELGLLEFIARDYGFLDDAMAQSYPDVIDECEGMAEVAGAEGWTMDRCMALAYGEIVLDFFEAGMLQCSQFAAAGPATVDGELIHGRNLDWGDMSYLLDYPTIMVRAPEGLIPYVVVGFPGCVAAYNGMNTAGLSIATNENGSMNDLDREGVPTVQGVNYMLSHFTKIDEVIDYIVNSDRMSAENMVVTSGHEKRAVVFQMTASHIHYEELGDDGVNYITNHFVTEDMQPYEDPKDPGTSTYCRYMRLRQLLEPGFENVRDDKVYGSVDPAVAAGILRDRYNPIDMIEYPKGQFDVETATGGAIAVNAAIYSIVFKPASGQFWFAYGSKPIPDNPFVGFNVQELLGNDPAAVAVPAVVE
ncbi:MAG TPA: C45 family autoproteolytic acyltransferase/hydrolase [Myxococcota bacterium]|nr:C45 family autoproteolytic acyltransferase/hydrolase [Myxococcota bacterium]HOD00353.1 C45 family autoproteolytic acyltransferase/hydrolase [Myxococcota bacterium]HPV04460.1 C45 family autoproteolytic acyltransferase/hydrolase [Myxococcota bacterium]